MQIIVTGAGGFVGRALIAALGGQHDVVAVDHNLAGGDGIEGDRALPELHICEQYRGVWRSHAAGN